jgi:SAM-dependent methyltransferase
VASLDVRGQTVLEVGSADLNGSTRSTILEHEPRAYTGVDIEPGPGVDQVVGVEDLVGHFGAGSFDVVVTTEMLEHVRDWRGAIANLKAVVRKGGVLLITTRSIGFHYHGYPYDYWRYEPEDMRAILADFEIIALQRDSRDPGVFVAARRLPDQPEVDLVPIALHSMVTGSRAQEITAARELLFRLERRTRLLAHRSLPEPLRAQFRRLRARG